MQKEGNINKASVAHACFFYLGKKINLVTITPNHINTTYDIG